MSGGLCPGPVRGEGNVLTPQASVSRTNNETDAWNVAFVQQVGHSHQSLFTLIKNLCKDNALVIAAIQAESHGQPPKKRVNKSTRDLRELLFNLYAAKRDGSKTVIQLLQAVGLSHAPPHKPRYKFRLKS